MMFSWADGFSVERARNGSMPLVVGSSGWHRYMLAVAWRQAGLLRSPFRLRLRKKSPSTQICQENFLGRTDWKGHLCDSMAGWLNKTSFLGARNKLFCIGKQLVLMGKTSWIDKQNNLFPGHEQIVCFSVWASGRWEPVDGFPTYHLATPASHHGKWIKVPLPKGTFTLFSCMLAVHHFLDFIE